MAFVGENLGLRQLDQGTWLMSFMKLNLGYLDVSSRRMLAMPTKTQTTAHV